MRILEQSPSRWYYEQRGDRSLVLGAFVAGLVKVPDCGIQLLQSLITVAGNGRQLTGQEEVLVPCPNTSIGGVLILAGR